MTERERLPARWADLPGGAAIGALLEAVDRSRLNGHDLVVLAQARARQLAHLQAQLLADLDEVVHCPPGDEDSPVQRMALPGEFAAFEVAAALTLTRRASEQLVDLAYHLRHRLPAVHAALAAGEIDLPRARLLCERTLVLG